MNLNTKPKGLLNLHLRYEVRSFTLGTDKWLIRQGSFVKQIVLCDFCKNL